MCSDGMGTVMLMCNDAVMLMCIDAVMLMCNDAVMVSDMYSVYVATT